MFKPLFNLSSLTDDNETFPYSDDEKEVVNKYDLLEWI